MAIHSLKNLKLARIFSGDIERIIKEVNISLATLEAYKKYKPVARILVAMQTELGILSSYKDDCSKIISSKGEVAEEKEKNE